jgi:flagellar hook-length control protein FliK
MDPTTNFLTAPTPAARAGELPSPGAGTDSSPQSSEFAGVFNGQMLKLERQALASAAPPAAGLQVVPLGNKLSVITTDAPLPDMATLADFARAQGLGESAVQALFGATSPKFDAIPALTGAGIDLQLAGLASAGTPVAAMTLSVGTSTAAPSPTTGAQSLLAQLAASVALKDANAPGSAPTATSTVAPTVEPTWFGVLASPKASPIPTISPAAMDLSGLASQATAPAAAAVSAPVAPVALATATAAAAAAAAAPSTPAAAGNPLPWAASQAPTTAPANKPATAQVKDKTPGEPDQEAAQAAAFVPVALMLNARLGASPKAASRDADAVQTKPAPVVDATSAQSFNLASAVQAGLAVAANAQAVASSTTEVPNVQISSLTVTVTGKASTRADAAALLPVASAVSLAVQAAIAPSPMEPALPPAPAPTSLRLTLTPPDQAITRRLAQASGNNKQISWAALLSGAKVSDVLAGATPVTNAAAAPLVAPGLPLPAALPAPATPLAMDAAPTGTPVSPALPTAQTLGASGATTKPDAINLPPAANAATNAAALATPAALALATNAAKTWENVHIEVPQGLDLEALQAERLAASDAEPSAPAAFASAAQSSAAPQNTAVVAKAEAATPQALAEQRAAHYQQLADRVGEAIAQRLIAQIERGQWKMQMRMQPGALGQIDVQLDMHAAGLDASFSADNAMTRELMAQGANRLRDALTEAGTTVASVWVNGDSSRQSGGNPTPGRNNQGPSSASAKKTADPSAATVAVTASNADSDGLNVLA